MRKPWCALVAVGVLAVSGCGGGQSFAERDPEGYEACSLYAEFTANTDSTVQIGGLLEVVEVEDASWARHGSFGVDATDRVRRVTEFLRSYSVT